uniref:Elongation of very long chain fatty acids protein n=1 Tax=Plectus sambesii TaxID=2011161 RepID=A0A914WMV7_9BILA
MTVASSIESGFFDADSHMKWFAENRTLIFGISATYIAALKIGQNLMRDRQAFKLKHAMVIWNAALALFSVIGSIKLLPDLLEAVANRGFVWSYCTTDSLYHDQNTGFWSYLFLLSKVIEFGDSFFVVLRKRKLILLQWYHHSLMAINVWISYPYIPAIGRWTMTLNYVTHAFMYSYYSISMGVTGIQIGQMITVVAISTLAMMRKLTGDECDGPLGVLLFAVVMLTSFLLLFCNFFYNTYVKKIPGSKME